MQNNGECRSRRLMQSAQTWIALGARIKKARENNGFTVEQLANNAGIDTDALKSIENGEARPTPEQLLALTQPLGVKITWFFEEE